MKPQRLLRHLLLPQWWYRRRFGAESLRAIAAAVGESERRHRGELRFVVEGPLPWRYLLRDRGARERATDLFGELRVWDTQDNSGVLIYVQMVDRRVEILADRGIAVRVAQAEWDALCRQMEQAFAVGQWREGALAAIDGASALLSTHFPPGTDNPNELPDAPVVL